MECISNIFVFILCSDDILRAISKLKVLGSGFSVIPLKGNKDTSDLLIRSVPGELSADHTAVIKVAESQSFTSVVALKFVFLFSFSNQDYLISLKKYLNLSLDHLSIGTKFVVSKSLTNSLETASPGLTNNQAGLHIGFLLSSLHSPIKKIDFF